MNLDELQKKLFAAARQNPPSDTVPYLFEKRIMARLCSNSAVDVWTLWSKALWQAAVSCVAFTVLLSVLAILLSPAGSSSDAATPDVETAVFAPIHSANDVW